MLKSRKEQTQLRLFFVFCFSSVYAAVAYAADAPQITAVRAGFAGHYKVGAATPLQVTARGGTSEASVRLRATAADSDGLNCIFASAGPCQLSPNQETILPLCVRFGHESSSLKLDLVDKEKTLVSKTMVSSPAPSPEQIPNALQPGQRLIVSVGAMPGSMEGACRVRRASRRGMFLRRSTTSPNCPITGKPTKASIASSFPPVAERF